MRLFLIFNLLFCFTHSCLAGGFPVPTYEWFREEYEADKLIWKKIDPMVDKRYTLSGGSLIINNPKEVRKFFNEIVYK